MKTSNNTMKKYYVFLVAAIVLSSCSDFLDQNPDESFATFESLKEIQALLDNIDEMNGQYAAITEYGADTYFTTTSTWKSLPFAYQRPIYLWQGTDGTPPDGSWNSQYAAVLNANVALDELSTIGRDTADPQQWDKIKGEALFFRGFYFLNLSQIFIPPYNKSTAESDLGLPLRLDPDPETPSARSSVQETYDQILTDLRQATQLLPDLAITTTRPSKAAAYGALARTFLSMNEYDSALVYANQALQIKNDLIDYNSLNLSSDAPIPQFNDEEIFYSVSASDFLLHPFYSRVDTILYNSYDENDLRKEVFFAENSYEPGRQAFTGDYSSLTGPFGAYVYGGIATDEMYLVRAECYARTSDVSSAMQDLNTLLEQRWKNNGSFTPVTASTSGDAITKIIAEREKELLYRGHRWTDIRRLKGTEFAITPKRVINGKEYILSADDPTTRYTYLIPSKVIELSGMQQNK